MGRRRWHSPMATSSEPCLIATGCDRAVTTSPRMIWSSWPAKSACCRSRPSAFSRKWRLQPGKIFLVDMKQGRIVDDREIKSELVDKRPWRRWIEENMIELDKLPTPKSNSISRTMTRCSFASMRSATRPKTSRSSSARWRSTAAKGSGRWGRIRHWPVFPISRSFCTATSSSSFAQVTNPPLDANFEELVTSLYTYLGREGNLLDESPKASASWSSSSSRS